MIGIRTTYGTLRIRQPMPHPISVRRRANFFDSGLYEPKPENPNRLPRAERARWDNAYDRALDLYSNVGDEIPNLDEVARRSAWRSLDVVRVRWPNPRMLPDAGPTIGLGKMIEYAYVDEHGALQIRTFDQEEDPPDAYWDHENKRIYCFPYLHQTECERIPPELQYVADIFRTWSKHEPKCYFRTEIPDVMMYPMGMADSITYRSDKFDKNRDGTMGLVKSTTYIHDHGPKVWTWQDEDEDNRYPQAILICGGKLDMHKKGLIH